MSIGGIIYALSALYYAINIRILLYALIITIFLFKLRRIYFIILSLLLSYILSLATNYIPIALDEKKFEIFQNMQWEKTTAAMRDAMINSWFAEIVTVFIFSLFFNFLIHKFFTRDR